MPSFFWLNPPTEIELTSLPWEPRYSILTNAFGILELTTLFVLLLHILTSDKTEGTKLLYLYIIPLIAMSALSTFDQSGPLEPKLVSIAYLVETQIPILLHYSIVTIAGIAGVGVFYFFRDIYFHKTRKKN